MKVSENKNIQIIEENLRSSFQIPIDNKIIICRGLAHALTEVTRGLYSVYPHRMGLVYQTDGGPDLEKMLPFFSREGFPIQGLSSVELKNIEGVTAKISKTGLFTVVCDDDPMTGELFDHKTLEAKLNELKSFCIRVSYNSFLFEPLPIQASPYSVRILSISDSISAVILGARSNIDRLLFGNIHFEDSLVKQVSQSICKRVPDRKLVQEFESKIQEIAKPLFSPETMRLFDRSVLFFENADGSAVLDHAGMGGTSSADSTSLCRWADVTGMEWLKRHGLTDEQIRGLVIIDISIINEKTLLSLKRGYLDVLKKQNGPDIT